MLAKRNSLLVQVAIVRHVALILSTVVAFSQRAELPLSPALWWVASLAYFCNAATAEFARRFPDARAARWLSVMLSFAAWGVLIALTGGAGSLFVAGLWVELLCSLALFKANEIVLVTVLSLSALGLQQAARGEFVVPPGFWVQGAFTIGVGVLTVMVRRNWAQRETHWHEEARTLGVQLAALERELDASRQLTQIGERAARQAHLLKSTAGSLRGLLQLVETADSESDLRERALSEIGRTIDRLQQMARANLHAAADGGDLQTRAPVDELQQVWGEVALEVQRQHSGVRWSHAPALVAPLEVCFSPRALREVALVLMENAAEAAGKGGSVWLGLELGSGRLRLDVEDDGPGLGLPDADGLFRWGATSKAHGHGAGLFLSKRLVEAFGGELTATPREQRGMRFSISLPVVAASSAEHRSWSRNDIQ